MLRSAWTAALSHANGANQLAYVLPLFHSEKNRNRISAMLKGKCHCGAASWTLDKAPESVTSCNCTVCRRYGVLWAYGYLGHSIETSGSTSTYRRTDCGDGDIDFHFCSSCGCVTHYVGTIADEEGRYWTAVNVRMTDPTPIGELPVNHFDGNDSFERLPSDDRKLKDMWF